jgi:hypothetical protein
MAEQSFLSKFGLRLGVLGSAASLAIAAPLTSGNYDTSCHTDAARIGWYFDRTVGAEKCGMIVGGQTGPLYTRSGTSVNMSLNTPGAIITVGDGTGTPSFILNGAAGTNRTYQYQTAGVARWDLTCNNTAESGSNTGSDLVLNAYTDAGALVDMGGTVVFTRAALGPVTINRPIVNGAGTFTAAGTMYNANCTWNNAAVAFTAVQVNVTDTLSNPGSLLINLLTTSVSRFSIRKDGQITQASVDDLTSACLNFTRTFTLTGNITDSGANFLMSAAINGAFTVTRYNYINILNPTGAATITNGCVLRFNANAGTHKAVDSGTTKTTPGGVDAWMKQNINGTIYFQPLYLSKTA